MAWCVGKLTGPGKIEKKILSIYLIFYLDDQWLGVSVNSQGPGKIENFVSIYLSTWMTCNWKCRSTHMGQVNYLFLVTRSLQDTITPG